MFHHLAPCQPRLGIQPCTRPQGKNACYLFKYDCRFLLAEYLDKTLCQHLMLESTRAPDVDKLIEHIEKCMSWYQHHQALWSETI